MNRLVTGSICRGKVKMDVEDGSGQTCIDLTAPYLERLNSGGAHDVEFKPEYHQAAVEEQA